MVKEKIAIDTNVVIDIFNNKHTVVALLTIIKPFTCPLLYAASYCLAQKIQPEARKTNKNAMTLSVIAMC